MKKNTIIFLSILLVFVSPQVYSQTWSALKRLTYNAGDSWSPKIAVDPANRLHVVWRDTTSGSTEIYYKRSTNGGTDWWAPQRLTWNAGNTFPDIAADYNYKLHIVWVGDTPGTDEIFYKGSTDGGITWSATKRLTWSPRNSSDPAISADSGNGLHVVWVEYYNDTFNFEIFYKRSQNSGATWSAPKRLTWIADWSMNPAIAADSGSGVHIAYTEKAPGNIEIFYKRSTDNGTTWSATKRLTWDGTLTSQAPSIAVDSSNRIHLVWFNDTSGSTQIFYKNSTDNGVTWSALKKLTWMSSSSANPSIASDSAGYIHIAWNINLSGNKEIYYKNSSNNGANWSATYRVTWNGLRSEWPSIAADFNNDVHVVWENTVQWTASSWNGEVYYKNRK